MKQFTHIDAYTFGQFAINKIQKNQLKPIRIRIVIDNDIVFQYLMEGKSGETWLDRKQKTVEKTHVSSLEVYKNKELYKELIEDESYAICGGGYPIIIENEYKGCIIVSGLAHEEDHQIIIDILKEMKKL